MMGLILNGFCEVSQDWGSLCFKYIMKDKKERRKTQSFDFFLRSFHKVLSENADTAARTFSNTLTAVTLEGKKTYRLPSESRALNTE